MEPHSNEFEGLCIELDPSQIDQVGGGVMVPLPVSPVINWIIRKLIF